MPYTPANDENIQKDSHDGCECHCNTIDDIGNWDKGNRDTDDDYRVESTPYRMQCADYRSRLSLIVIIVWDCK